MRQYRRGLAGVLAGGLDKGRFAATIMQATHCRAHEARQQEGKAHMADQVFVKVLGFDDTERHALNTLFRLSESGPVHYLLWAPDAPAAAKLALVDGESYEAQLSLGLQQDAALQLVWVGDNPPAGAARTFARPLHWPHVVQAMDSLFGILPDMDLDLGMDLDVVVQVTGRPGPTPRRLPMLLPPKNACWSSTPALKNACTCAPGWHWTSCWTWTKQ
jgi:hypothetical protein